MQILDIFGVFPTNWVHDEYGSIYIYNLKGEENFEKSIGFIVGFDDGGFAFPNSFCS